MATLRSLCVYCGSSPGHDPDHVRAAHQLGLSMAKHGVRLVYGGGTTGMMGAVASGVRDGAGDVLGIIPEFLLPKEAPNYADNSRTTIEVVETMHVRKHRMFEESDAFVALPGGIGTLEEIIEVMTWGQLGRHRKPMVFANIKGYFDPMVSMLSHAHQAGFLHQSERLNTLIVDDVNWIIPEIQRAIAGETAGDASIIHRL